MPKAYWAVNYYSIKHPLNAPDFSSYLLQAQASKAKIIAGDIRYRSLMCEYLDR